MKQITKIFTFIVLMSLGLIQQVFSCTIFIANDNNNIWVGNNEDDNPDKNYRLWFVPSVTKEENSYIIWAAILKGWAEKMSNKFPEGGMNEYGLFIDAAALPEKIIIKKDASKKDWKGYVIKDVLKKCKTVQEALLLISQYNLIEQEKAQIFMADASGDYAIVHANYIIKKETANFALSNYCLNDNKQHICWRRSIVSSLLTNKSNFGLTDITNILDKSAQTDYYNKTNYSIAANLKQGAIHLFQHRDFRTDKVLNVKEELQKGERSEDMINLFPKDITIELEKTLNTNGLSASMEQYKLLKINSLTDYNFNNNDVVNFAIRLIGQGKINEATSFLKLTTAYQPDNSEAKLWLGVAQKLENDNKSSSVIFAKLLQKQPQHYLINLFGNQKNETITFSLDHFEDAKTVFLAGDFTDWKAQAIEMKKVNNVWVCKTKIPKGERQYKFIVDEVWVTDPKNTLTAILNKDINSKLIVW